MVLQDLNFQHIDSEGFDQNCFMSMLSRTSITALLVCSVLSDSGPHFLIDLDGIDCSGKIEHFPNYKREKFENFEVKALISRLTGTI